MVANLNCSSSCSYDLQYGENAMPAILAMAEDRFVKPLYPLLGDELGFDDHPEAFALLTEAELPPEFTTYNSPFMIDDEDFDFEPKLPKKPKEAEIDPGLLPPPLADDAEDDGVKVSDFDFDFDEDFAEEEDDEYGIEHAMDDEEIPDKLEEIESAADDVAPPADDEEIIPEDVGDDE
jgi:hypothetical protein